MSNVLEHLRALVACDTQNPPRHISKDDAIFAYLASQLDGFSVEVTDHGDGCVSFLAVRGRPDRIINVHLDTVPANRRWEHDPHELRVDADKAYGLGACDIKGGAAAAVAAAMECAGDIALLFTTDEEYGHSVCVHQFLASGHPLLDDLRFVVVSEPTSSKALVAHRGFARMEKKVFARPGHSSDPRGLTESANHRLAHWLTASLARAEARDAEGAEGLSGMRFNCGVLDGGKADNIIAGEARALCSVRPPPGFDPAEVARDLLGQGGDAGEHEDIVLFEGPAFPATDAAARVKVASDVAEALGVEVGPAVDFWTEAALFSAAGYPAFVYGPGDIAQAHTANEWVRLRDLDDAVVFFKRYIEAAGLPGVG